MKTVSALWSIAAARRPLFVGILILLIIALVAGVASAQSKPSGGESLIPQIKIFDDYRRDSIALVKAHHSDADSTEYELSWDLHNAASSTGDYLGAARGLLGVYDIVSCERDRANIQPLIKFQLSYYDSLLDSQIDEVNRILSFTKVPGIAATAVRMKDDLRDVKARFEAIEAALK